MHIESSPEQDPERPARERGSIIRRFLGKLSQGPREEKDSVSKGDRQGSSPANTRTQVNKDVDAGEIFDAALAAYKEETKWEAGRTEGRIFPELAVGAQAYPDPGMWGPDTEGSLLEDEHYLKVGRMLDKIDREDGFDGRSGTK
jgi:hypothetical protein